MFSSFFLCCFLLAYHIAMLKFCFLLPVLPAFLLTGILIYHFCFSCQSLCADMPYICVYFNMLNKSMTLLYILHTKKCYGMFPAPPTIERTPIFKSFSKITKVFNCLRFTLITCSSFQKDGGDLFKNKGNRFHSLKHC